MTATALAPIPRAEPTTPAPVQFVQPDDLLPSLAEPAIVASPWRAPGFYLAILCFPALLLAICMASLWRRITA